MRRKYHRQVNYTSVTTTWRECFTVLLHSRTAKNYREEYHQLIQNKLHVPYVWSFAGGRMALYCILKALGIGKGDEVILQGYTCSVVPKTIMYLGAIPKYVDISATEYNMTFDSFVESLSEKTKAVIVQHTYGIPCQDVFRIREYCRNTGLWMIEDCAHLFGNKYCGEILGTIGDAAFFSTDHTKYISTSVGGLAITLSDDIAMKMDMIYSDVEELPTKYVKGIVRQTIWYNFISQKFVAWIQNRNKYFEYAFFLFSNHVVFNKRHPSFFMDDYDTLDFPSYPFPAKLSQVQSLVGISQLLRLGEITAIRETITKYYWEELHDIFDVSSDWCGLLRYPIQVDNRDAVISQFRDLLRIDSWFSPPLECVAINRLGDFQYDVAKCKNAMYVANRVVNLPIHPKLRVAEIEEICARIKECKKAVL